MALTSSARANYVISVSSLSLAPGGTGTLNVNIDSTAPSGNDLDTFGFEFQITTSRPTLLEFTSAQPNPYSDSAYVFFGNSLDQGPPLFPLGIVSSVGGQSNTYTGDDGTVTGSVHIGGTAKLLLQMSVTAATGSLSPLPGDTFTIGLVPNADTFFSASGSNVPFSSTPGTVTIATASVPEPASLVLFGLAISTGAAYLLVTRHWTISMGVANV
jgi:hypothetical protein